MTKRKRKRGEGSQKYYTMLSYYMFHFKEHNRSYDILVDVDFLNGSMNVRLSILAVRYGTWLPLLNELYVAVCFFHVPALHQGQAVHGALLLLCH